MLLNLLFHLFDWLCQHWNLFFVLVNNPPFCVFVCGVGAMLCLFVGYMLVRLFICLLYLPVSLSVGSFVSIVSFAYSFVPQTALAVEGFLLVF